MLQHLESKRFLFVRAISREREAPSKKRQSQKSGQNFVAPGSVADKSRPPDIRVFKGDFILLEITMAYFAQALIS
jgi:hypothetical protein